MILQTAVVPGHQLLDTEDLSASTGTSRSQLYDLAEILLTQLVPGWDEVDEDEDEEDVGMEDAECYLGETRVDDDIDDFDDEDDILADPVALGGRLVALASDAVIMDPVVDASYLACMREAERFLVQCEGLAPEGAVVSGLRHHLQQARVRSKPELAAVPACPACPASPASTPQLRPRRPGYP